MFRYNAISSLTRLSLTTDFKGLSINLAQLTFETIANLLHLFLLAYINILI